MTIEAMKQAFVQAIEAYGDVFVEGWEDVHEKIIVVKLSGISLQEIEVSVGFDVMPSGAIIITIGYYDFTGFAQHRQAAVEACNTVNRKIRGKCFLDEEGDVVMTTVLPFNAYSIPTAFSAEQVLVATLDMAMDADKAYDIFSDIPTTK